MSHAPAVYFQILEIQMLKRLRETSGLAAIVLLGACGGGGSDAPSPPAAVATVSVTASTTSLNVGSTLQLTAVPRDVSGNSIAGLSATWLSSNQGVAAVNGSGLVTGIAVGSATITATVSGIPGSTVLSVAAVVPTQAATVDATINLDFSPSQVDIVAGGTVTWRFAATVHNVTFSGSAAGTPSGISNTANTTVARTFSTAGTFAYQCTLHQGMTGSVVVH